MKTFTFMTVQSLTIALMASSPLCAEDKPLPDEMLKIMHQPKYEHATWGVYAKDLQTGNGPFSDDHQREPHRHRC